ncbi:MAG: hypothetical protein CMJ18_00675 [Phycisphaeraceae bacterium]|nr:hypothetical protein [Phycisphaeraceae bacterium]
MKAVDANTLEAMRLDLDHREEAIRNVVYEALHELPEPDLSEDIVATYFVATRDASIEQAGTHLAQLETTNVRSAPAGSLLEQCTGKVIDSVHFESTGKTGLIRVAFPLKMLVDGDGNIFSTLILYIAAGAGAFALRQFTDAKLVHLDFSQEIIGRFPGPAYGAPGVRRLANFGEHEIAFGTIVKPSTGITPDDEARVISEVAPNPMLLFLKEDEHFFPDVDFSPLRERLKPALKVIADCQSERGGKQLIFAPHIGSPLHVFEENLRIALDCGVNAVMFSEYYSGGLVRLVRDKTKHLPSPPAIYGHNGGISSRTRHIYREVLDLLARLDGIDFRQTAPLTKSLGMLRPSGREWRECEKVLSGPLGDHPPVMIARSGGLDQGNIIPNLADIAAGAGIGNYLFLSGTAITGVKNRQGEYDAEVGTEAMRQVLAMFEQNVFTDPLAVTPGNVKDYADAQGYEALSMTLAQRYRAVRCQDRC